MTSHLHHGRNARNSAYKKELFCLFALFYFLPEKRNGDDILSYLRIAKTAVVRRTPLGIYIGLPHNTRLEAFSTLLEIDESTEMLFMLCDGTHTQKDICEILAEHSGEPVTEIEKGLDEVVEYMVGEGILEVRETPSYIEPIYQGTRPYSLTIGLTFNCNLHCSFCSVEGGVPFKHELTLDDIVPVVEQVKKLKPSPFGLSGGEPLLKKELALYILEEVCPVDDMYVNLFTNGTLITKDYAHQLYDAGLRCARVSVDGHTAQVHDAMRGKGTFEKTIQGIQFLKELGIHIETMSLITKTNYPYVKEIKEFVTHLGDTCLIGPINPMGRGINSPLLLTPEERINTILTNFDLEKIQTTVAPRSGCLAGLPLYIDPKGDIYPCFYMMLPEFKIGNVKEHDLCEIYKTDLMKKLMGITIADIEECKDCDIRYFCGGSCRAAAYRCGGSLFVPDALDCEYYKDLADKIMENGEEITKRALQELLESTKNLSE